MPPAKSKKSNIADETARTSTKSNDEEEFVPDGEDEDIAEDEQSDISEENADETNIDAAAAAAADDDDGQSTSQDEDEDEEVGQEEDKNANQSEASDQEESESDDKTDEEKENDHGPKTRGTKRSKTDDQSQPTPNKKQKSSSNGSGNSSSSSKSRAVDTSKPNGAAKAGKVGSKHDDPRDPNTRGSADRLPEVGQQVHWKALPGYVDGEVVEILKEDKEVDGKKVKASDKDPRIILQSNKSGKICVHKADAVYFD